MPESSSQNDVGVEESELDELWSYVPQHQARLMELFYAGKIKPVVDPTEFKGIESIVSAVEYLHSGNNCGKVVVRF